VSQPIDVVYVDVEARGEEKAARDIERAAKDVEATIKHLAREIEDELNDAGREMATSITAGAEVAKRAVDDLADDATRDLRRIESEARDAGESIARGVGGGAVAGSLIESLSTIGAHLRNISAILPSPFMLLLAAATPAIIALAGALTDLSAIALLLPGAIGVLASVIGTLHLAFDGFGAAVTALASGDLEKINEALKELSPSARVVARDVAALKKPFDDLKRAVQESFFAPLRGDLRELGEVLLPVLRSGLSGVGGALGRLASDIVELLGEVDILNDLKDIFASTARIIDNLAPHITKLLGTLFGVAEHGMPFLERGFDALGRGLDALSGFLSEIMSSGDFDQFLEDAFQIMKDLGGLTKSVFGLLSSLFGDMGDEGSSFIQTLTKMTDSLTAFFDSADGQKILQAIVDTLPILVSFLGYAIVVTGEMARISLRMFEALQFVGEIVVKVGKAIGEFFSHIDEWASAAGDGIDGFFDKVGNFFGSIGDLFKGIGSAIGDAFNTLLNFVNSFLSFITDIDRVSHAIGFAIGTIISWFLKLREWVNTGLVEIIKFIINGFRSARDFMLDSISRAITGVLNFLISLRDRIPAMLDAIRNFVVNAFKRARDGAVGQSRSLYDGVINFFNLLPGRAANLIGNLRDRVISIFHSLADRARSIGRNILDGIISGIRNGYSAAVDTAKRIARGILDGMKDALGIGSPSRLAAIEVGRPIMQGVGVGATDEAFGLRDVINRAVVSSLPDVTGGTTNTGNTVGGQTVTFGEGAVQIVFQGAVPTEQEALRTGQAVGTGIAQTLAKRSVRTAVRIA